MTLDTKSSLANEPPPFELKGSLFTLTILHLKRLDYQAIADHLNDKVQQAPSFFNNAPVVIDLDGVERTESPVDFNELYRLLRGRGMVPVGVRNGSPGIQAAAILAGVPLLPDNRTATNTKKQEKEKRNRIIHQAVRSGQRLYYPDVDLIIIGAVGAGAEVLSDGHVHIYGPLRGRAFAGIKGDVDARIFCHVLEAELVSIAGFYRVSEEFDETVYKKATHIYLADDQVKIESLFSDKTNPLSEG